jgi:hypothetical protein
MVRNKINEKRKLLRKLATNIGGLVSVANLNTPLGGKQTLIEDINFYLSYREKKV